MQVHREIYTVDGSGNLTKVIPLPDAAGFKEHFITITAVDAALSSITPASGTVVVTASDDGNNFGTVDSGTIDLTTTYDRPNILGYIEAIKVAFTGLPANSKVKVLVHSYL